jgi:hypothetical protein
VTCQRGRSLAHALSLATAIPWTAPSCSPGSACTPSKDYWGWSRSSRRTPKVRGSPSTWCLRCLDQIRRPTSAAKRREAEAPPGPGPADRLDESEKVYLLRAAFMAHPENLIGRFPRVCGAPGPARPAQRRGLAAGGGASASAPRRCGTSRSCRSSPGSTWNGSVTTPALRALIAKGRDYTGGRQARPRRARAGPAGRGDPRLSARRGRRADRAVRLARITTRSCRSSATATCTGRRTPAPTCPGASGTRRTPPTRSTARSRAIPRCSAVRPPGMWPSEGSVSEEAVTEMARAGLRWTASDEGVLERSIQRPLHRDSRGTAHPVDLLYRPWIRRTPAGEIAMLFRDRHAERPHRVQLLGLGSGARRPRPARAHPPHRRDLDSARAGPAIRWCRSSSDGEKRRGSTSARAAGPSCGRFYAGLQADPRLRSVTMSEAVAAGAPQELPRVFAGSWIHSDFSVWIGPRDDRRAWDLLGTARDAPERRREGGQGCPPALGTRARGLPRRLRQRLVLVVRRRPLVRERLRVRSPVPPAPARGLRGPRPARARGPLGDDHHHPPPRGTAEPARGRGHARRSTARSRRRTSGKRRDCTGCR